MRKTKGWDWSLSPNADGRYGIDVAQLSVLMDIRDELQRLNGILQCPNFIAVPAKLDQIAKNTRKRRKPRAMGQPKLRVVAR